MNGKEKRLLYQIGGIADRHIGEAAPGGERTAFLSRKTVAVAALAACVCIVSVLGIGILRRGVFTDPPDVTTGPTDTITAPPPVTDPPPPTLPPVTETTPPPITEIPPDTDPPPAIGGDRSGDALWGIYIYLVDFVSTQKDTFTEEEEFGTYMNPYAQKKDWGYDRPCVMYYLVQEMELTREELEIYYAAIEKRTAKLGYETIPEYVYTGLLTDSLAEMMQLFKSPYAFYHDEKLYNVYDVYELDCAGTLPFDAADEVYDAVWENILAYVNTDVSTHPVHEELLKYIEEHAQG